MSVINAVFCLVQYVLIERWPLTLRPATKEAAKAPPAARDVRLPTVQMLRRPPEGLGGTILYMQMEDHYLRVHSDEGTGLTLHRMSDAAEDLAASDGRQVHRSWWASRAAVERAERANRRTSLIMRDGAVVPVGRSYEKALREAGWL